MIVAETGKNSIEMVKNKLWNSFRSLQITVKYYLVPILKEYNTVQVRPKQG